MREAPECGPMDIVIVIVHLH